MRRTLVLASTVAALAVAPASASATTCGGNVSLKGAITLYGIKTTAISCSGAKSTLRGIATAKRMNSMRSYTKNGWRVRFEGPNVRATKGTKRIAFNFAYAESGY